MSDTDFIFRCLDGTEVRWASDAELQVLAAELSGESALTDTLVGWRAVSLRADGKVSVHILGLRDRRPVIRITSEVLRLGRRSGLVATRSGSLYKLIEHDEDPPPPVYRVALQELLARWGFVALAPSHQQPMLVDSQFGKSPITKASARCAVCGDRLIARLGQQAATCRCKAATLHLEEGGRIYGCGALVGIRAEERVRPMIEAPQDGRAVRVYMRGRDYRAYWESDARGWREVDGSRIWHAEILMGWTP